MAGDTGSRDPRVRELLRRIEALESQDESAFGSFNRWDWILCVTGCVVLPLLLIWKFAA